MTPLKKQIPINNMADETAARRHTPFKNGILNAVFNFGVVATRPARRYFHAFIRSKFVISALSVLRSKSILVVAQKFTRNDKSRIGSYLREVFDPNLIRHINAAAVSGPCILSTTGLMGERYRANINDHISWQTFARGYFDLAPIALGLLFNECFPGKIVIDVGANVGTTSIPLAKVGITIIGIEASPGVASDLSFNVSLNSPIPYSVINLAVTSPEVAARQPFLNLYAPPGNFGASSLIEGWAGATTKNRKIELSRLTTLDQIVQFLKISGVSFIKMDIEGSEYDALLGSQEVISKEMPAVTFEWRPDVFAKAGGQKKSFLSLFPQSFKFFGVKASITGERCLEIRTELFNETSPYENVLAISDNQVRSSGRLRELIDSSRATVSF
jgi:FkbM family methyltransferase